MNGVLLYRSGTSRQRADLRPHLEELLDALWSLPDRFTVAVWSSMMPHNLHPLVELAFGERARDLAFVWDQEWCTRTRVPELRKPLMRKDLKWLMRSPWGHFAPDHVLLVDDDPLKCTANPPGTAVHPSSFDGTNWDDSELVRLATYLRELAVSVGAPTGFRTVREFVLARPFDDVSDAVEKAVGKRSYDDEPIGKRPQRPRDRDSDPGLDAIDAWAEGELDVDDRPAKLARGSDPLPPRPSRSPRVIEAYPEAIEAYWPDDDTWLQAELVEELDDGTMRVHWGCPGEEDRTESIVPPQYVRRIVK